MFSHSTWKYILNCCNFDAICLYNAAINCINSLRWKASFPSALTGHGLGCILFYDASSITRLYIVDDMVISEWWWIVNDFVESGRGLIVMYYPGIRVDGLRKTTKHRSQDSLLTGYIIARSFIKIATSFSATSKGQSCHPCSSKTDCLFYTSKQTIRFIPAESGGESQGISKWMLLVCQVDAFIHTKENLEKFGVLNCVYHSIKYLRSQTLSVPLSRLPQSLRISVLFGRYKIDLYSADMTFLSHCTSFPVVSIYCANWME
jgi:hypothetical protein